MIDPLIDSCIDPLIDPMIDHLMTKMPFAYKFSPVSDLS